MSQENVEIVRRYFELIDRMLGEYWLNPVPLSEYPETEQAFNEVHPDAEWKPPHMEAFRGKDAWLAAVSDWLDAADHWRIVIEDVSDLGGDRVLVESRNAIRGKGSGLEVDQAISTVVTVREGRIAAIWDFTDRQAALEAAQASK
ncbi:MAG: nuclear transport factor 2 family protein [Solirubrobacterales bacterium]